MKLAQYNKVRDFLLNPKYDNHLPEPILNEILEVIKLPDAFPIGTSGYYIYYRSKRKFLYLDINIEAIFEMKVNELYEIDMMVFFSKVVEYSHYEAISDMIAKSFEICKKNKDIENIVFNLEYNIRTPQKSKKRILCQYIPYIFSDNGYPDLVYGYYTDITHLKKDGLPMLYVTEKNRLIHSEEAKAETIIRNKHIPFTKRQVEILKLMSKGFSAKEVAQKMNLSVATIYTQSKLIKNKTGMDVKAAIKYLDDKGLI